MSKLYLHKKSDGHFKTNKQTIVADMDNLRERYIYDENIFKLKKPKELIITGNYRDDFICGSKIIALPVERVVIDAKDLDSRKVPLYDFINCKELLVTENCNSINITNNFGLSNVEHITIPFNINGFENVITFFNKVNKITIQDKEKSNSLILGDKYINVPTIIRAYHEDSNLILDIFANEDIIKYTFYYKEDELVCDKKIISQTLNLEDKEVNLIELKKKYDYKINFKKIESEKIILNKEDLSLVSKANKNTIKELIIKDSNEMKLIPSDINIKLSIDEIISNIEKFSVMDKELYIIEIRNIKTKDYKCYFINDDLTYFLLPSLKPNNCSLNRIEELHIDYNSDNFKYEIDSKKCLKKLTIPKIDNSNIINNIICNFGDIYIKKDEEFKLIYPEYVYAMTLTNNGFIVHYSFIYNNYTVAYTFDPNAYGYINDKEFFDKVNKRLSTLYESLYKSIDPRRKVLVKKYE